MLGEVRAGMDMLRTLASAPAAVAATGSPFASAAIVALNLELGYLLADLVKCIDADIEGITKVQQNYRNSEDSVCQLAELGAQLLSGTSKADRPRIGSSGTRMAIPAMTSAAS
jgi:hypothetical protein